MTTVPATLDSFDPQSLPSTPPLLQRLVDEYGATWVNVDTAEAILNAEGNCVLFIAGDPVRFPECLDVAVVLPELQRAFPASFRVAIAERASEDQLANRFGASRRPALVFLRYGRYVTNVSGMLDWEDYLREVGIALSMPVSRVPGVGIPIISGHAASGCH